MNRTVVIGNGPAAHRLVDSLHRYRHQWRAETVVVGAEPQLAYNRALLTAVVGGRLPAHGVTLPGPPEGVRVLTGVRAVRIDRERREVWLDNGERLAGDNLVLATGARPRIPAVAGIRADDGELSQGVTTLRTVTDCARITGDQLVVLGGGVLGVEAASALRDAGRAVTLVHRGRWLLDGLLDQDAGRLLDAHLRGKGVRVLLERHATGYRPGELRLDGGETLRLDTLVLCTGVVPETGLATGCGLGVRHGILVDDRLRTDDPHIHAIGDCAEYRHRPHTGIAAAWEQAEILGTLLAGGRARYRGSKPVTRIRMSTMDAVALGRVPGRAGDGAGTERVTVTDPARGRYASLSLRDGRVTGAVLLGFPEAIATVSQLYDRGDRLPFHRSWLIFGTEADDRHTALTPLDLPDDAVICRCNNVTKRELVDAWRDGAHEPAGLAEATRATSGCGSCRGDVGDLCAALTGERVKEPAG